MAISRNSDIELNASDAKDVSVRVFAERVKSSVEQVVQLVNAAGNS